MFRTIKPHTFFVVEVTPSVHWPPPGHSIICIENEVSKRDHVPLLDFSLRLEFIRTFTTFLTNYEYSYD